MFPHILMTTLISLTPFVSPSPIAAAPPSEGTTLPGAQAPVPSCNTQATACHGSATYYTPGLGACGQTHSPSDLVFAFSQKIMGSLDTNNALCGQKVKIVMIKGRAPVTATGVDKCMSCIGNDDLDLSDGLFKALGGDEGVGTYTNMTWWWA